MLFNSFPYLLAFLPLAVAGFVCASIPRGTHVRLLWIGATSLFFYAFWNPWNILILIASTITNFLLGLALQSPIRRKRLILTLGILGNIIILGVFKYAAFAAVTANTIFGVHLAIPEIALPLAISFITFQKIAFLIDVFRGKTVERNFLRFCAFVTFFPQLIAGPIVHHREIVPQMEGEGFRLHADNLALGITLIVAGLCKKVLIADALSPYASTIFGLVDGGKNPQFLEAWTAALAYTFQLYFDFSGYVDMATGSARLFGIILPLNFNSPYKATSIIDFWRRWHITLSRFLREYIYFSLGGNRRGKIRQYGNLFLTMLIGGLWHGAGWTFVFWGALHGAYLVFNHAWRALTKNVTAFSAIPLNIRITIARCITFLLIVIAWVFFRATTLDGALRMLAAMTKMNALAMPTAMQRFLPGSLETWTTLGIRFNLDASALLPVSTLLQTLVVIGIAAVIALAAPNMYQLLRHHHPALGDEELSPTRVRLAPSVWSAMLLALATFVAIASLALASPSEFLYFRF